MKLTPLFLLALASVAGSGAVMTRAQIETFQPPVADKRLAEPWDLNKVYSMPVYRTRQEWVDRARYLRQQVLASAGLLPMPVKSALNAKVFDRAERQGYTVEKVYFESHPGFYVTGNLYRPAGKSGLLPAVLSPHGHWPYGRLENSETCSVPGLAINMARQGFVVFAYDMIGYNDSTQLSHSFGGRREELWGISLAGLQLWNSIRAVDFLSTLPYVDKERIAATGASGGGTQTFLLMAVDDRVKAGAPVNMVSAHMQGGCLCENAPGLRIDTFNVELAALAAPRPLLLVSATGDWTRNTLEVEYPAIKSIYRLFGAEERLRAVRMNAPHNYNKESREAVYAWFGRWLLGGPDEQRIAEKSFAVEALANALVFYGAKRPANSVDAEGLTTYLIEGAESRIESLRPRDEAGVRRLKEMMGPAFAYSLAVAAPAAADIEIRKGASERGGGFTASQLIIGRKERGDRIPATLWTPARAGAGRGVTLVVHESGRAALAAAAGVPQSELVKGLLESGQAVLSIDCFQTGAAKGEVGKEVRHFTTYNRTDDANRVQDIITAIAYLKGRPEFARVNLVGIGKAGLWCLLARAFSHQADRAAIDVAGFDNAADEAFMRDLFAPGLRRAGDLRTAVALAAPSPLLLHNTGERFKTDWMASVYGSYGRAAAFRPVKARMSDAQLLEWLK